MSLLAVDAGRSEIEYKSETTSGEFPSAVVEAVPQNNPALVEEDLEIEVDGKKWWVGRLAQVEGEDRNISNFSKSKADEILKIQVISAIIYAGLDGKKVDLGVLVPIKSFTDEEKAKIRNILKGEHEISYSLVEETKKQPTIKKCRISINEKILISPEGAAAYWADPQEQDTQTLDFGAKTINYAYYNFYKGQSTYVNDKSGTEWIGWETIKHTYGLSDRKDEHLDPEDVEKMAYSLSKKAIDSVNRAKWKSENITQIFGGVAHQVYPYIKNSFPRAYIPNNPRNGNVNGLYKALEEVHSYVQS